MPCSPEQLAANRQNSAKSTGPTTPEGKARSRANSLKHGLTGQGIVIPPEDQDEVTRRSQEFRDDFRPKTGRGRYLIDRAARLSVRLDRSFEQESAQVAQNVRCAPSAFDESRRAEVERLIKALHEDPEGSVRQLRQMPEGVDALLKSFLEVRANLLGTGESPWNGQQGARLRRLTGRREEMDVSTRLDILCQGSFGTFWKFKPEDGAGLNDVDRKAWARRQILEVIDQEIASLRDHRETLDFESIALDRAESGARALFDPSMSAERARKYEATTERNFFKTLNEYRKVEAEAAEVDASEAEIETSEELASSFPDPDRPQPIPAQPPELGRLEPISPVSPAQNDGKGGPIGSRTAIPA